MWFDRFDVCEAYYLYAVLYHGGQGSKEYALHSVFIRLRFKPAPMMGGPEDLTENGRAIYDRLVETNGEHIRDRRFVDRIDRR